MNATYPRLLGGLLLALACGGAGAQGAGHAAQQRELAGLLPAKHKIVSRVDADISGDNLPDAIVVSTGENFDAVVTVLTRLSGPAPGGKGSAQGLQTIDSIELDLSPHGPPTAAVKNGVLVVEHPGGGNTVRTQATYRFRLDAEEGRMRLIGLDAERTGSDTGVKLSWNVLTGKRLVRWGKKDAAAFVYGPESASAVKPAKVWMADTPKADDLLDELVEKRRK